MSEMSSSTPLLRVKPVEGFEGAELYLTRAEDELGVLEKGAFNLGLNVNDDASKVLARRLWLQEQLGCPIQWLNQIHGCEVYAAKDSSVDLLPNKDASVTASNSIALAVLTADCLPVVFFASGQAPAVGIAHAGWKGLAAGVLEATARQVAHLAGADLSCVSAWMGPAIGSDSFEVGSEVKEVFVAQLPETEDTFRPGGSEGKFFADLYRLAEIRLGCLGVRLQGGGWDTFKDTTWFSHRASQGDRQRPVGRFATLVRLVPSL